MKQERLKLNSTQIRHSAAIISKNRIRAPRNHGEALVMPPTTSTEQIWKDNRKLIRTHEYQIGGQSAEPFRARARNHLIAAAAKYTAQYRDPMAIDPDRVILSGHQPRLFHPGVWFKNFALSALGQRFDATAINLIVDNDLCGLPRESVPIDISDSEASMTSVAYDQAGGNLPFENRMILDRYIFDSFASRLTDAISPVVAKPLVTPLWKNTERFVDPQNRLGHTIAAARHQLEGQFGLQTLEIPLSLVCQSTEFATFVAEILSQIVPFQQAYNESLHDYREVYRIRSNAHPVPELEAIEGGFESPFWIWSKEQPIRRGLYVLPGKNHVTLTNRKEINLKLSQNDLANQLYELQHSGIAIRPRALMTTMYSRLVLSDLFLHGIGGAKYDQLTDAIATRFWKCLPPVFMTLTATMKLPFDFDRVTPQDLRWDQQQLRELRFHPEKHLDATDKAVSELIETKRHWIEQDLPKGHRKERHDSIVDCNERLQSGLADVEQSIQHRMESNQTRLARTRILDARNYSFCCFDEQLVAELSSLAEFENSNQAAPDAK